jgi:hypothetical protein
MALRRYQQKKLVTVVGSNGAHRELRWALQPD